MKSISGKNWEQIQSNKRLIEKIKIDHNLNQIQSIIVNSREFSNEELFLIRNHISLINPFLNSKDFLIAFDLLKKNIINEHNILIIGDYDVDGCISTSLMVKFLAFNKGNVNYYIPDRFKDGYGANKNLIVQLINKYEPKLIIFLDCGSSAHSIIQYIKSKSINSIIIDHHNTTIPHPTADVFINPKKNSSYKKYDYLCTTFLTYMFIDLYIKLDKSKYLLKDDQIYVLLATVADVMPIRGINKVLAINVLKKFNINSNIIFKNIFKILDINKKLEIDDLSYKIAPIINSAGRLENANQIVEMLTTKSINKTIKIISKINDLNNKRKLIEKKILDEFDFKDFYNQKGVIFIYKPLIHEGIIGIIAARIKEYYNKPCIVFTNSGNLLKGSARSTFDFNIGEYINKAYNKKIIIKGGGHNLAAGITLYKKNLNSFIKFINKYYNDNSNLQKNFYISKLSLSSINLNFLDQINFLGPYGNKNPYPLFLIENVEILKPKIIKDKFVSFFIKKNKKIVRAISFNHLNSKIPYTILNSNSNFDLIAKIKDNKWNNKRSIVLEIIDLIKNTNKT